MNDYGYTQFMKDDQYSDGEDDIQKKVRQMAKKTGDHRFARRKINEDEILQRSFLRKDFTFTPV